MSNALPPGSLVVVASATGYLGAHVTSALLDAGYRVRALARDPARLGELEGRVQEVFVGQATDPASIRGLCDGAAAVFTSIGIRQVRRKPSFWRVDRDANLNLVAEAERAGVRRFVFTSVFGAAAGRARLPMYEAKEQVADALAASRMRSTVLRPTGYFNDMAEFFEMARAGRVWLFGDGAAQVNPIHAADLAEQVVLLMKSDDPPAGLDLGGPQTFTMREIGKLAFYVLDRPARFGRLPLGLLSAGAALVRPFNGNLAGLLSFFHAVNRDGAVAPAIPGRRLEDTFRALAAEGKAALAPASSAPVAR